MTSQMVIILFTCASMLSVDALRCYQCNSHLDPGCSDLTVAKGPQREKYLTECKDTPDGQKSFFCRKFDMMFDVNGQNRIIRSCGFIQEKKNLTNYCINADNEGYDEEICQCFQDGCNTATSISTIALSTLCFGILSNILMYFIKN